jgi:hypothetical protein
VPTQSEAQKSTHGSGSKVNSQNRQSEVWNTVAEIRLVLGSYNECRKRKGHYWKETGEIREGRRILCR